MYGASLQTIELAPAHGSSDPKLRERFLRARIEGRTVAFLAFVGEEEAGLLVFDHWPNHSIGIIDEIFVLERFARRGLGTMLLAKAHSYAVENGIGRLQLAPRRVAFGRFSDQELVQWYGRHGFNFLPSGQTAMSKDL